MIALSKVNMRIQQDYGNVSINLALERSAFVNLAGSCLLEKRICRSSAL